MAVANISYSVEQGATLTAQLTITLPASSAPAWSNSNTYLAGNVVTSGGTLYQCILGNTNQPPPNVTYWSVYSGTTIPVDLTNAWLRATAKTNINLPDTDPTVVKVDWQETTTPTYGKTWFTIPATQTVPMVVGPYNFEIRLIGAALLPAVTPIVTGVITVLQPVSSRS